MVFEKEINLIREIYGNDFIPLHRPSFSQLEKEALTNLIDTNFVSSAGPDVVGFEEDLAKYTKAKYVATTVNGTSALHICLHALGVNAESQVITQALTFVATGNAIKYTGAEISFIDVENATFGMCPKALKNYIYKHTIKKNGELINKHNGKIIKACVPMHTFGFPCNMKEIISICKENNIRVIEDCAESLGSFIGETHTGNFGEAGILSFNGNKTITTGGGGAVLTNCKDFFDTVKHLTTTAKVSHRYEYFHDRLGFNYRMPNLNAALGRVQLQNLDKFLKNKRKVHHIYSEYFKGHKSIRHISESKNSTANYWLNVILMNNKKDKEIFLNELNSKNIAVRPFWVPLNRLPFFSDCHSDDLVNTNNLYDIGVNLPSSVTEIDHAKIL